MIKNEAMEQYILKSALVAEIERRLSLLENGTGDSEVMKRVEGVIKGYKSILSFIDSLEEDPVSNDLEKAAESDVCEVVNTCSAISIPNDHIPSWVQDAMVNEFIHGAQWQKQQDQSTIELAEDHAYLAGQEKTFNKAYEWVKYNNENGGCLFDGWEDDFKKAIEE